MSRDVKHFLAILATRRTSWQETITRRKRVITICRKCGHHVSQANTYGHRVFVSGALRCTSRPVTPGIPNPRRYSVKRHYNKGHLDNRGPAFKFGVVLLEIVFANAESCDCFEGRVKKKFAASQTNKQTTGTKHKYQSKAVFTFKGCLV